MKLLYEIEVNGKPYCVVNNKGNVSVMPEAEYKQLWGWMHPEKWGKTV